MKHTHTATPVRLSTFLSCGTLPFRLWFLHRSFRTLLSTSFIHEKPSCVISTYLFGCLGSKSYLSLSLSVLQCTFSPCDLGWIFPRSILSLFPYLKKLFLHWRGRHFLSRPSCSHHVQTAISSFRFRSPPKKSFHWEVSLIAQSQQRKKIPSQKNCISKSPVEKSSVVPSNVCLGSATRITNFTNHSHHYTASTTRCKE